MDTNGADLLTVIEMVYHRPVDGEHGGVETRFNRKLQTQEQMYQRKMTVGEAWVPLDLGWLDENGISALVLVNNEEHFTHQPTEEELAELAKKVIQIGYAEGGYAWDIPPGESFRGTPTNSEHLFVRCVHGSAKCTLTLIPR